MPFKDVVEIVESLAVIIAAVVAVVGIDAWRREHVGKRRIELAEEVLAMFYEVRMLVEAIRSRHVHAGEGATRQAVETETPDEKRRRDLANVANERFGRHRPKFAKLSSSRFRFMAVFGADKVSLFERFDQCIADLLSSASTLEGLLTIDQIGLLPSDYAPGELEKMLIDARRAFYGTGNDDDWFRGRLDALIRDVEAVCRKEIVSV